MADVLRRFEPLGPISGEPIRRYEARDEGGRFVQVHEVPRSLPGFYRLMALVEEALGPGAGEELKTFDLGESVVVVTPILPQVLTLEDWLRQLSGLRESGGESDSKEEDLPRRKDPARTPETSEAHSYSDYVKIPTDLAPSDEKPTERHQTTEHEKRAPPSSPSLTEELRVVFSRPPKTDRPGRGDTGQVPAESKPSLTERLQGVVARPPKTDGPGRGDTGQVPAKSKPSLTEDLQDVVKKPPKTGGPGRGEWVPRKEGLPPIQMSLREYLRRLESREAE